MVAAGRTLISGNDRLHGVEIVRFDSVPAETWDGWVHQLDDASFLHSWSWLSITHLFQPNAPVHSYAVVDRHGRPVALCPLGFAERTTRSGERYRAAEWQYGPLAAPAIRSGLPPDRRRTARAVFDLLHAKMREAGAAVSRVRVHPMTVASLAGRHSSPVAPAVAAGYVCWLGTTIVIDLRQEIADLEAGMTQEQRKHIGRMKRLGAVVRSFRGDEPGLAEAHESYRAAHFAAAGRATRPEGTFEHMLVLARTGRASLFVLYLGRAPASYLYCLEFDRFALGVSQANVEGHGTLPLRHMLEWHAVLDYRRRSFAYYEVGQRPYGPTPYESPSEKEISIARFKERYGGVLLPHIICERWFDPTVFAAVDRERSEAFAGSLIGPTNTSVGPASPDTAGRR